MGSELVRKYVSSSIIVCYRSVVRHPFLVSMVIILYSMHRLFPLLFSLLLAASPVIVSTAVLLGTLLSFGQPNIPEIDKEYKSERDEIRKLESKVMCVGKDASLASEETNGSRIEVSDKSFEEKTKPDDDNSCVEADILVNLVDGGVLQHGEAKNDMDEEKVVLGSHYSPLQQSEDEHIVLESDDKLWEGSADPLNSNSGLLWKRMEGNDNDDDDNDDDDNDDEDEDDEGSDSGDSGSDLAESSSPDASMADIIPMLDELHPLLSEEHETRELPHMSHDGTEAVSEHSLESSDTSSESNDDSGVENHENLRVGGDENEDQELKHIDKEDEARSVITWTEDDQKNLMNLGTSEIERNRRLENLIARRRARKTMRMQAEKNLIDLESVDLPWNIPPISTSRNNPFDYDSNDNIPGSAPSVLLQRRNPFDLPYDSSEEKPDLVGDTFQQEFAVFQSKEPFFRRHESFNVGPSIFGASRNERQETKLRPYFVPERSFSTFQRQFSGLSDSKVSSVPDTESVSSASDPETKDHIEDNEQSLEADIVSENDHKHANETREYPELISESEHVSNHGRPYFLPEQVASDETSFSTFQRQLSEVSDSKVSSVPDTDSVSSASDLENKDHMDDDEHSVEELKPEKDRQHDSDASEHPEVISEREHPLDPSQHVSDHASHGSESLEDDGNVHHRIDNDEHSLEAEVVSERDHEHDSDASDHPEVISEREHPLDPSQHVSDHASHGSKPLDDDGNVQVLNVNEGLDETELSVGGMINQQETETAAGVHLNLDDEELLSRGSSLSSSFEASDQIYNEKEGDEVATSVTETNYYFVDPGNSRERSDIEITSLLVEENQPKEPVYDSSPRAVVTRNFSSSSISNDLQADVAVGEYHLHRDEGFHQTEDQHQSSSCVADVEQNSHPETRDAQTQLVNVPDNGEPLLAGDSISTSIPNSNWSDLETEDVKLDVDASNQLEQVQAPSLDSQAKSLQGIHQEEGISQLEESLLGRSVDDLERLQGRELEQGEVLSSNDEAQFTDVVPGETHGRRHHHFIPDTEDASQPQNEFPLLDTSVDKLSEENPEVLHVQASSNYTDHLQIQELENNVSLNINSVSSAEPDVVEVAEIEMRAPGSPAYSSDTHSIDVVDEMKEIDENLLVELDAVGDFSVSDLGSSLNEMKEGTHSLEDDKQIADEDSYSDQLGSVSNEMKQDLHVLKHDLETSHRLHEDSDSKDLGSTFSETKQENDIETKYSEDEEGSDSKDIGSTLDEMKQYPHSLEHDLKSGAEDLGSTFSETKQEHDIETKYSEDEGGSNSKNLGSTLDEMKQDPHSLEHNIETKRFGYEDSSSKNIPSTLDDMEQDPHDLQSKLSGDEDSYSMDLGSTLNEMKQDPHPSKHDLETNLFVDEESFSMDLESTLSEMRQDSQAMEHRLETFYSVDENFYSKHVESTLNEMKQVQQALDQDLETNRSGDEVPHSIDPCETETKIDAEVAKSLNKEVNNNSEIGTVAEPPKTKLSSDVVLPKETDSRSSSAIATTASKNASSTSNTDKE